MNRIYEEIYEKLTNDNKLKPSKYYWTALQKERIAYIKLKKSLTNKQIALLNTFTKYNDNRVRIEVKEQFINGLKNGFRISK